MFPGQACAYMLGQLKLVELRDKAQKALGSRYSPQAFYSAVRMTGTAPLSMLEREVDLFITNQRRDRTPRESPGSSHGSSIEEGHR